MKHRKHHDSTSPRNNRIWIHRMSCRSMFHINLQDTFIRWLPTMPTTHNAHCPHERLHSPQRKVEPPIITGCAELRWWFYIYRGKGELCAWVTCRRGDHTTMRHGYVYDVRSWVYISTI